MKRYIDANDFKNIMYHEAFETDTEMQRWDGGCWIRYKLFENILEQQPTADVVENKVLRLLLDWAIECGFGYDSIPEEYKKYKDDIQDMSYTDGLIYIAMKEGSDYLHREE